ncbi:hypothetical protein MA16_Dca000181 [Dendrobium catenatum]|uniref:Uncharacterized protein n=1 Tax=Dendrobium catenatum TaxID=906689 RepID=A0A2I0WT51_9ASPA|nr:hypothetical protein MA16_Dca000181 [Dendrobium catenatum]
MARGMRPSASFFCSRSALSPPSSLPLSRALASSFVAHDFAPLSTFPSSRIGNYDILIEVESRSLPTVKVDFLPFARLSDPIIAVRLRSPLRSKVTPF